MKIVIQRVKQAKVKVNSEVIGKIQQGLLILIGVEKGDELSDIEYLASKILNLRIFEDENSKMKLSVTDIQGEILAVSQFTLLGDCRKGRRPSFDKSAKGEEAMELYNYFVEELKKSDLNIQTGQFGAHMEVELINDGPLTFILDSKK
ncbi:MAG: D-tyrosyl-tRNA(Tyr) deacylase [Candidatus Dadabacteria bacterium]|nr:D-tyrosyl-tRNA(Tyr) deacylase [Candidatus Dadabacteria bacterium]NIX15549.1 D-tyrosyl-tRNA(Tyr) deacylase [Candidatus Dadabacteria bacterium]NIY22289.1 D-tyrosyl-tRNA(Tyr) deacylase [Candidatus Dadabacteria bacterium]